MTAKRPEFDQKPLQDALRKVQKLSRPLGRDALRLAAEGINSEAQIESPVLSGHMAEQHIVDASNPDDLQVGVNTPYAHRQHESHATKRHWYLRVFVERGPEIVRKSLKIVFDRMGAGGRQP